jgi:hypothetical protein
VKEPYGYAGVLPSHNHCGLAEEFARVQGYRGLHFEESVIVEESVIGCVVRSNQKIGRAGYFPPF